MKLILPVLADIGHGILATFAVGYVTDVELSWHFIAGIAFALLPDLDAVPRLIRTGSAIATKNDPKDHREYMHYPAVFLIFGFGILMFDSFFGLLFVVATMLHFFNDTWGTGHGLAWLWPLSKRNVKIGRLDVNKTTKGSHIADIPNNDWIDETYLHFNSVSIIEYTTFGIAVAALLVYVFY